MFLAPITNVLYAYFRRRKASILASHKIDIIFGGWYFFYTEGLQNAIEKSIWKAIFN
jgi:hypothetical protein